MAVISKALARTAASTASATLYTVPAATTAVITNIAIANASINDATFTINLDGIALVSGATVPGNGTTFIDLKQVLAATKTITGFASTTDVKFHISGVELV